MVLCVGELFDERFVPGEDDGVFLLGLCEGEVCSCELVVEGVDLLLEGFNDFGRSLRWLRHGGVGQVEKICG